MERTGRPEKPFDWLKRPILQGWLLGDVFAARLEARLYVSQDGRRHNYQTDF
jgi:hypothetical protein